MSSGRASLDGLQLKVCEQGESGQNGRCANLDHRLNRIACGESIALVGGGAVEDGDDVTGRLGFVKQLGLGCLSLGLVASERDGVI